MAFLVTFASALDTITTLMFVRAFGSEREINPFMRALLQVGGGWALVVLNVALMWFLLMLSLVAGFVGLLLLVYIAGWRLAAGILNLVQYLVLVRRGEK